MEAARPHQHVAPAELNCLVGLGCVCAVLWVQVQLWAWLQDLCLELLCVPSLQQGQEEWGAEKSKQPDPYLLQSGSATLSTASGAWWEQTGCTGLSSLKLHDWVM